MSRGDVVGQALALVAPAEAAFRSRWRLSTLQRLSPDLYTRLREQIDLFNEALVTGSDSEAREQAEAMVRGWRAACAALEAPLQPDDAYFIGWDHARGLKVVISESKHSVARVQSLNGERVLMISPDEVARMVSGMTMIAETKCFFPDAELTAVSDASRNTSRAGASA